MGGESAVVVVIVIVTVVAVEHHRSGGRRTQLAMVVQGPSSGGLGLALLGELYLKNSEQVVTLSAARVRVTRQ